MPVWCPNCHAMLPEGVEKCPRCGAPIKASQAELAADGEADVEPSDVAWYSGYTIAMILIPLLLVVGIGLLCFILFLNNS